MAGGQERHLTTGRTRPRGAQLMSHDPIYGYPYEEIEAGDIIEFENGIRLTVSHVEDLRGTAGMGGMSMGSPDRRRILFDGLTYVDYDPWMDLPRYRVPFRIVSTNTQPKHIKEIAAYRSGQKKNGLV